MESRTSFKQWVNKKGNATVHHWAVLTRHTQLMLLVCKYTTLWGVYIMLHFRFKFIQPFLCQSVMNHQIPNPTAWNKQKKTMGRWKSFSEALISLSPAIFNYLKFQVMEKGRGWCYCISKDNSLSTITVFCYTTSHRERTVGGHPANLNLQGLVQILVGK